MSRIGVGPTKALETKSWSIRPTVQRPPVKYVRESEEDGESGTGGSVDGKTAGCAAGEAVGAEVDVVVRRPRAGCPGVCSLVRCAR